MGDMMRKFLISMMTGILSAGALIACSSVNERPKMSLLPATISSESAPVLLDNASDSTSESSPMVGGWVPVFFNQFDKPELDNIATDLNSGRVKQVAISYPTKMQPLANKIKNYLQTNTNKTKAISMNAVELKDTDQVTYNLTQVILTLYFN